MDNLENKYYKTPNLLHLFSVGFLYSIFSYLIFIISIQATSHIIQNTGIFENIFNISKGVKNKAFFISSQMEEKNLALNFLGNIRMLSFTEANQFQSSGLLHLLAISGGQVVPIASGISQFISYIFYYILRSSSSPLTLMNLIYNFKTILSLILSLLICHMFGCSGALIRVSSLTYLSKIKSLQSVYLNLFPYFPNIPVASFNRIFILILISLFFGNILINYSFLLSAIGASCAEISLRISYYFIKKSKIFIVLSCTSLTSIFTGLILYPFSSINLFQSCMANLIALPIVCFLITPFSLLLLFLPQNFIYFENIISMLDFSLSLLKKISFVFSEPYFSKNPFEKNNPLFKKEGLFYLNSVLFILWITIDLYKERKIYYARKYFFKL
ncbi:ComEC/Rec2 family competence protein [Fluviispira multicolorata]|uniref:ComEC/Rec2-related protein domain-containing protein n=1 Tax=Fluviispira multicolorata TaxID=2654512 RepID=A0A833JD75_9BACT|nr:ComEC/Rec2 family competence protein [Fluviispira multicolorata]KAB8030765.1 hypothetical protein GCL57_07270 [Fluviispira multicolorata]